MGYEILGSREHLFLKQLSKEYAFDGKEKYNLEVKAFEPYCLKLVAKKECCLLNCILDIDNSIGVKQDLLIKHTLISEANVISNMHETWGAFATRLNDDGKFKIHNPQMTQPFRS